MKKLVMTALVLAALVAPANAEGFSATESCVHNAYSHTCRTVWAPVPEPIRLTAEERAAQEAEFHKWQAFCKPTLHQDRWGVSRYSYAHEGCDLGRSE